MGLAPFIMISSRWRCAHPGSGRESVMMTVLELSSTSSHLECEVFWCTQPQLGVMSGANGAASQWDLGKVLGLPGGIHMAGKSMTSETMK